MAGNLAVARSSTARSSPCTLLRIFGPLGLAAGCGAIEQASAKEGIGGFGDGPETTLVVAAGKVRVCPGD
jgi:hypothetical protein